MVCNSSSYSYIESHVVRRVELLNLLGCLPGASKPISRHPKVFKRRLICNKGHASVCRLTDGNFPDLSAIGLGPNEDKRARSATWLQQQRLSMAAIIMEKPAGEHQRLICRCDAIDCLEPTHEPVRRRIRKLQGQALSDFAHIWTQFGNGWQSRVLSNHARRLVHNE